MADVSVHMMRVYCLPLAIIFLLGVAPFFTTAVKFIRQPLLYEYHSLKVSAHRRHEGIL